MSEASMMARTESLWVRYATLAGEVAALRGLDLEVRRGEFVALMGSSGCGKSTLLHVLGGLLTPTSGRVEIDGDELGKLADNERTDIRRRKIGFVFQRFNLLPSLTVEGNLRVAAWLAEGARADGREACEERQGLLNRLGVGHRAQHRPARMSGGEQQRVAIARALVNRPALILADEPTGSLDSTSSAAVLSVLRELNREQGQTIVMITHDAAAAAYASRVLRMSDGRIEDADMAA